MSYRRGVSAILPFHSYNNDGTDNTTVTPTIMLTLDNTSSTNSTNTPIHKTSGRWHIISTNAEMTADIVGLTAIGTGLRTTDITFVTEKTTDPNGLVSLAPSGLDAISIESGVNARQALSPILAASAGVLLGAGTGTIIVKGGFSATTRITATTDNAGNRTAITLTLPA